MSYKSLLTTFLSFFCFSLFSQVDTIPPDVHCFFGLFWEVDKIGDSLAIGSLIDTSSYNTDEFEKLTFSFSKDTIQDIIHYNCDLFKGYYFANIPLWITDDYENQSFCEPIVLIRYTPSCEPICGLMGSYILFELNFNSLCGKTLDQVKVERIIDSLTCEVGITNELGIIAGQLGFENVFVSKKIRGLNGVTTLDVILIGKHVLGIDPINSPLELLAADVDNSGDITMEDAQLLARIITGDKPLDLLQWKFIPRNYRFSDWTNPFKDDLSDFQSLLPELPDNGYDRYDIIGIKLGDVNGSYNPELD